MAFSEVIKLEAKRRANFACVICHQAFVEVHHILPEGQGGPNTLENAAPLCGSCHDLFGGNPDKRKQIREMRDFWWELCEKGNSNPDVVALNRKLDAIQSTVQANQVSHQQMLIEVKNALLGFHNTAETQISSSGTVIELSNATGIHIPRDANPAPEPRPTAPTPLSHEAKLLLKEAVSSKEGTIIFFPMRNGIKVRTNGKDLGGEGPRQRALWQAVIQQLVERNLIWDPVGEGRFFRVTDEGYRTNDRVDLS